MKDEPVWAIVGILAGMLTSSMVNPSYSFIGALTGGAAGYLLAGIARYHPTIVSTRWPSVVFLCVISLFYSFALYIRQYYWHLIFATAVALLLYSVPQRLFVRKAPIAKH